jgi:hypothetical protein
MFPDIGPLGGTLFGVPALTSRAAGVHVVLVDAADLVVTDDGLDVEQSTVTSIQMDSAPSAGAADMISAFQTGSVFLKLTRHLHWTLMHSDAVGFFNLPI